MIASAGGERSVASTIRAVVHCGRCSQLSELASLLCYCSRWTISALLSVYCFCAEILDEIQFSGFCALHECRTAQEGRHQTQHIHVYLPWKEKIPQSLN